MGWQMNKAYFFKRVRGGLFGGKLSASQVDGMTRILDYRDSKWPGMSDDELAYVLATVKWETAHTMQPIKERGSQAYLRSTRYWPWIGDGLVQLTWKANYAKFDVVDRPEQALEWPTALDICFRGMIFGKFTGRKLSDYIGQGKRDYVGARRIINGTDKAKQIAQIAEAFRDALEQAKENVADDPAAVPIPEDEPQTTGKPMAQSTTVWAQVAQWASAGGAAALAALGDIPWQTALVIGALGMVAAGAWIIHERYLKSKQEGV